MCSLCTERLFNHKIGISTNTMTKPIKLTALSCDCCFSKLNCSSHYKQGNGHHHTGSFDFGPSVLLCAVYLLNSLTASLYSEYCRIFLQCTVFSDASFTYYICAACCQQDHKCKHRRWNQAAVTRVPLLISLLDYYHNKNPVTLSWNLCLTKPTWEDVPMGELHRLPCRRGK